MLHCDDETHLGLEDNCTRARYKATMLSVSTPLINLKSYTTQGVINPSFALSHLSMNITVKLRLPLHCSDCLPFLDEFCRAMMD